MGTRWLGAVLTTSPPRLANVANTIIAIVYMNSGGTEYSVARSESIHLHYYDSEEHLPLYCKNILV